MRANDDVTGQHKVKLLTKVLVLVAVFGAVLLGVFMILPSGPKEPTKRGQQQTSDADGGITPTVDELRTGESPEKVAEQRALERWSQSLGLSAEEQEKRQKEAPDAGKPKSEREARELAMPSGDSILSELDRASVSRVVGTAAVERDPRTGEVMLGNAANTDAGGVPYMTLHLRQMLAAQSEKDKKGGSSSEPAAEAAGGMVTYEEPKVVTPTTDNPAGGEGGEGAADASQRIPVNVIPPMTVPIFARFQQNFTVVGAGADTAQRIVVKVQQDVVHRHRVQLPKEAMFIGTTGGVRDLDLVDVEFDTVQFPDGTQVACKARAYQPFDPIAPDSGGMRGVIGEYEEPPLWSKVAPIFLEAARGYSTSNLDRLSRTGLQVEGNTNLNVGTSDKDRLYGAVSSASGKAIDTVMQNLNRYRPRVRVRAGQPLVILLDDYLDVSKRGMMGIEDPLKQQPKATAATNPLANPLGAAAPMDPELIRKALSGADPSMLQKAAEFVKEKGGSGGTDPAPQGALPPAK